MKKFGLLGEKLEHSFSPQIHRMLGDYEYSLYEVPADSFDGFMKQNDLDGFNVTIPYKQAVIPYCGRLSDIAERTGSVNTIIKNSDGTYFGDNTDYAGFLSIMKQSKQAWHGKKALVLGSGGASKTVNAVLEDLGTSTVITVSRNDKSNYCNISDHYDATLIVNTTPVGRFPNNGESLVDLSLFDQCEFVVDLIYNPLQTKLLLQAKKLGISSSNGLLMLAEQARKTSELFTGTAIPEKISYDIQKVIERQIKNIILIGMPGCGKSTIGKYLSEITGRQFVDTDCIIEQKTHRKIPDIFLESGEACFRAIETEVLADVCKESGYVISTGGGVVTVDHNRDLLMQNGTVVLLERDQSKLLSEGRPVSQKKGIDTLYRERMPLYRMWSDMCFKDEDPRTMAHKIKEALNL